MINLAEKNHLVLFCLLEIHKRKSTRATTEAIFKRTFDILMKRFVAYAHQVDRALNGSISPNIGSLLEVVFLY
jgi:hypothetical protein